MKNKLLWLTALALTMAGCTLMETRPGSPTGNPEPGGSVPAAPVLQTVPERGPVPDVIASTHIIVGLCPATGRYVAMGVDTQARKFTFLMGGEETTQQQAFQKFYSAGVPVTVYTAVTALRPTAPSNVALAFNPCLNLDSGVAHTAKSVPPVAQITEDPPPTPRPTGGEMSNGDAFKILSWRTAFALDAVAGPGSGSKEPAF